MASPCTSLHSRTKKSEPNRHFLDNYFETPKYPVVIFSVRNLRNVFIGFSRTKNRELLVQKGFENLKYCNTHLITLIIEIINKIRY